MSEPTSVLTFQDLVTEVARIIGVAHYGDAGTGVVQVPIDAHDLNECKRHVNNAIRMFFADAPKIGGWRFVRSVASVTLWASVAVAAANVVVSEGHDPKTNKTTLVATSDSFYASMELKSIILTGVDTFTITDYVDATTIKVSGNATGAGVAGVTWSIAADGNYTLPGSFSGQASGPVCYAADTDQGVWLRWANEATIRGWREGNANDTGTPSLAAIRPMASGAPRRRWELMVYPQPDELVVAEFPFDLHFDKLVDFDEVPPVPFAHDETLRAACSAVVERDVEDTPGPNSQYYREVCLPNSYRLDARSAPSKLSFVWLGGTAAEVRNLRRRPTVTVNPYVSYP